MKLGKLLLMLLMAALTPGSVLAAQKAEEDGVKVGKASALRNLVPAESLEKQAALDSFIQATAVRKIDIL